MQTGLPALASLCSGDTVQRVVQLSGAQTLHKYDDVFARISVNPPVWVLSEHLGNRKSLDAKGNPKEQPQEAAAGVKGVLAKDTSASSSGLTQDQL